MHDLWCETKLFRLRVTRGVVCVCGLLRVGDAGLEGVGPSRDESDSVSVHLSRVGMDEMDVNRRSTCRLSTEEDLSMKSCPPAAGR